MTHDREMEAMRRGPQLLPLGQCPIKRHDAIPGHADVQAKTNYCVESASLQLQTDKGPRHSFPLRSPHFLGARRPFASSGETHNAAIYVYRPIYTRPKAHGSSRTETTFIAARARRLEQLNLIELRRSDTMRYAGERVITMKTDECR